MNSFIGALISGLVITVAVTLHGSDLITLSQFIWATCLIGVPFLLYNIALWSLKEEAGVRFASWVGQGGAYKPYRAWLTSWLDWLDEKLCPPEYLDGKHTAFQQPPSMSRAWNWRAYDRNLLWAVAYPFGLAFLHWVILNDPILLGTAELAPSQESIIVRTWLLGVLILLFCTQSSCLIAKTALVLRIKTTKVPIYFKWAFGLICAGLVIALTSTTSNASALAITASIGFLFYLQMERPGIISAAYSSSASLALALAGAISSDFVLASILTISITLGCVVLVEQSVAHRFNQSIWPKPATAQLLFTLFLFVQVLLASFILPEASEELPASKRTSFAALVLFLGLFPLVNAVFDFASVGLTRYCLRQSVQEKPVFGLPKSWRWLVFNLIDLCAAALAFAGLIASLLFAIHLLNALSAAPLMPLESLMSNLAATGEEAPPMGWFYLMLLSTLLPTALHLALALIGAVAIHPLRITRKLFARPLLKGGEVTDKHREVMAMLLALWSSAVLLAIYFAYQALTPDLLADAKAWMLAQMNWLISTFNLR